MSIYITLSPPAGLFNITILYLILCLFGVSSSDRIQLLIALGSALLITAGVGRIFVRGSEGLWVHSSSERDTEATVRHNVAEEIKNEPWNIPLPPTRPSSPMILLPGTFAQEPEPAPSAPPESTLPSLLGDILPLSGPQSLNVSHAEEQFHSPGSLPPEPTSMSSSAISSSSNHGSSLQVPSSSLLAISSTSGGPPQNEIMGVIEDTVPDVDSAPQVLEYVSQTSVDSVSEGAVPTAPSTPEWIEDETYNPRYHNLTHEVVEHEQDATATFDLNVAISTEQNAEVRDESEGTASPGSSTMVNNASTATHTASSSAAVSKVEHQSSTSEAANTASTLNLTSPAQPSHSSRTFKFSPIVVPESATPRTTTSAKGRRIYRIQRSHRDPQPRGPSMTRPILSEASYERLVQEIETVTPRREESPSRSEELPRSVYQSERVDVKGKGRERQPGVGTSRSPMFGSQDSVHRAHPVVPNRQSSSKATPGQLSQALMVEGSPSAPPEAGSPAFQELSGAQFNLQATASPGQLTLETASRILTVSSSNRSTTELSASSSSRSPHLHRESSTLPSSIRGRGQGTQISATEATLSVSPANDVSASCSSIPGLATPGAPLPRLPNDTQTNFLGGALSAPPHQITSTAGSNRQDVRPQESHSASRGSTRPSLSDSSYEQIETSQKGKQRETEIVGQEMSSNVEGRGKVSLDMGSSALEQGSSDSRGSGGRQGEPAIASTSALPSRIPVHHIGASISGSHHPLETDTLLSGSINQNQFPSQHTSSTSSAPASTFSPSASLMEVDGSTSTTSQIVHSLQSSSLNTPAALKQPKPRLLLPDRCRIPTADEECYVCCDNLLEGGLDPNEYDLDTDLEALEQALMLVWCRKCWYSTHNACFHQLIDNGKLDCGLCRGRLQLPMHVITARVRRLESELRSRRSLND